MLRFRRIVLPNLLFCPSSMHTQSPDSTLSSHYRSRSMSKVSPFPTGQPHPPNLTHPYYSGSRVRLHLELALHCLLY